MFERYKEVNKGDTYRKEQDVCEILRFNQNNLLYYNESNQTETYKDRKGRTTHMHLKIDRRVDRLKG